MRKLAVAVWLGLSSIVAAGPATADGPIVVAPLAPGEVLLEVNAVGIVSTPATAATITVEVAANREAEADALRSASEAVQQVRSAARAAAVAEGDIEAADVETAIRGADAYGYNVIIEPNAVSEMVLDGYGSSTITVRVRDVAVVPELQRRFAQIPDVASTTVEYLLEDETAARRAARADALARARSDAEAYAAGLNMRVARVLRVTERADFTSAVFGNGRMDGELRALMQPRRTARIQTFALVGVDYALAPR
ncbi:SIMPL domain-containing protein [Allosphingosinicella sp.]|jgi:uncharacterized protein YggE|uniref:SIMPL domain-containing protein n=1 Tax=Allosphingosinicella sp. TaxID=2823234 RepID=UPI002EDCD379